MRKYRFLFYLLFLSNAIFGQLENAKRITKTLCSKEFYGRGYVNQGDSIAARFIGDEFQKIGLEKLNNNSFYQSFANPVVSFPNVMTVVISKDTLVPGIDYLVDPNCGSSNLTWKYTQLTKEELFDSEIQKRYISSVHKDALNISGVVIDIRGLKGDSLKRIRLEVIPGLAQQLDVLVLTDEKFTFSVGNEPLPYSLIYIKGSKFSSNASITTHIKSNYLISHLSTNVIGMIPALPNKKRKEKDAKTIFITAHYDHLGMMGKDVYFPGANDNASGVAMLLELANYYKRNPINYNIVFVAFAGEEVGLLGSSYFVQYPWIPLEKIHFLLNLDIMGSGEEGITVVNATLHQEQFQKLQEINEKEKFVDLIKPRGEAANSDHYWFSQRKVPAFFIYTMGPNKNYHDIYDTYDNLSFAKFENIFKLLSSFINNL
jgi:aminopeptidase YwaD